MTFARSTHHSLWPVLALATAAGCGGYSSPTPAPAPAAAPAPAERPGMTHADITAQDLKTRLYIYADDSMMGREAGTDGNVKATNYIAAQARQMGLVPAGDNGTYFQTIGMVEESLDTTSTLEAGATTLNAMRDFAFAGGEAEGAFTGEDVVYAGRVGDTTAQLTPEQIDGKVVVLGLPIGPDGTPVLRITGQEIAPYQSARVIAIGESLDLLPPQARANFLQPRQTLDDPVERTGGGLLFMLLGNDATRAIFQAPLDSVPVGTVGKAITGDVKFIKTPVAYPARNVVAILPGRDPALKREYVAIGAHNDHIGITSRVLDHDSVWAFNRVARKGGMESAPHKPSAAEAERIQFLRDSLAAIRPDRPDSINNGADDDGSGTVSVLEIAQAMAAMPTKPKRSVLFVWHTGEELGMYGSTWFTNHPTVPRDSIVAQINIDMIGRGDSADTPGGGPNYLQVIGSRRLSTELGDLVEQVNTEDHHDFAFDYQYDANGDPHQYYCRSDHYSYARYGIPIAFFTTGGHPDYHQVTDEPQEIDYAKMARVARFLEDVVLHVADLDHPVVVDHPKPDPHGHCEQ